jgi:hypothetical protein
VKRAAGLLLAVLLLTAPTVRGADDDSEKPRKPGEPTYESPVLSLLFLPVNLLIRMASVFGPGESQKSTRDSAGSSSQ